MTFQVTFPSWTPDWTFDLIHERAKQETALIEADLKSIPGVYEGMTDLEAAPLRLEIAYQRRDEPFTSAYRGIRRDGEWIIDHHPEWGEVRG